MNTKLAIEIYLRVKPFPDPFSALFFDFPAPALGLPLAVFLASLQPF